MEFTVNDIDGVRFVEGQPGAAFLHTPRDASRIVEACLSNRVRAALLYAENLTPHFFDLSSREAGEILQKVVGYRMRLAIAGVAAADDYSTHFGQFAAHEARAGHLGVFSARAEAVQWLADTATAP